MVLSPQVLCVLVYRMSHFMHANGWIRLAFVLYQLNQLAFKVSIDPAGCIRGGLFLPHPHGVVLSADVGMRLTMYADSLCCPTRPGPESARAERPQLGRRITIGVHAALIGPISVGDGTRVMYRTDVEQDANAGSVVTSGRIRLRISKPGETRT